MSGMDNDNLIPITILACLIVLFFAGMVSKCVEDQEKIRIGALEGRDA